MRISIKWKIILTFISTILIPTILIALVSLKVTSYHLENQLKVDGRYALNTVQGELSRFFSFADAFAAFAAGAVNIKNNKIDTQGLSEQLNTFSAISGQATIEIFDAKGLLLARSDVDHIGNKVEFIKSDILRLKKAMELETFSDYVVNKNGLAIKVFTPVILMENFHSVGVVVVTIPLNQVFMQNLKLQTKSDVTVQWNENGAVTSSFLREDGRSLTHTWTTDIGAFTRYEDVKIEQQYSKINNHVYLVSTTALTNNSGHVVGVVSSALSSQELIRNKHSLYMVIVISTIVFFLIAVIFGGFISKTFTEPIKLLADKIKQVAQGDLTKRVDIQRNDEIGDLAITFNDMAKRLSQSFDNNEKQRYEIQKLQNYLSNIINSMPSVLIGVDIEGRITQWNMKAEEQTGISVNNALSNSVEDIFPQISSKLDLISASISSRTPSYITNERLDTPEGTNSYQNVTIFPLVSNGIEGAVIRIDDTTKQYNLELQLNQSRKMDAIGELAGGVAHDFNNMLAGISGAAELLSLTVKGDGEKYVNLIQSATRRAASLTSKLLTFSRKSHIECVQIDVKTTVEDSLSLLERTIDKRIEISGSFEAEETNITGNSSQLENCLINIGINAGHAMSDGGKLSFGLKNVYLDEDFCKTSQFTLKPGLYVEISISDTGCGIKLENLKRIFEPFYTTREKGKGTGLGLAAVYGVIQEHQGAINVYSEENVGTVFKLMLPVSKQTHIPILEEELIIQGHGTILFVDDEEVIRITTTEIIEGLGYTVIVASDGKDAVDIFSKQHAEIDLVILDMIMPKMNGAEAYRKMKKIDEKMKFIISSGFTDSKELEKVRQSGLDGFINKPFRKSALSQMIAEVLRK